MLRARAKIDFGLSEDQEALQQSARDFLTRECPPALVRDTATSEDGVPRDLYRQMAELGWMGLIVPEKEGGLGLGALDLVLVLEELGTLLPYDEPAKLFQTLIAWGRYAELVDFDQNTNVVYLHEAGESEDKDETTSP